jgi:hypothetical protein
MMTTAEFSVSKVDGPVRKEKINVARKYLINPNRANKPGGNHSHPDCAYERGVCQNNCMDLAKELGHLVVFDPSVSPRAKEYGESIGLVVEGARPGWTDADFRVPGAFPLMESRATCIVSIDDDYHATACKWAMYSGLPYIRYGRRPVALAGQHKDSHWAFVSKDTIKEVVGGGAEYEHKVYNFHKDTVRLKGRMWRSTMYDVVNVPNPPSFDPSRGITVLLPYATIGSLRGFCEAFMPWQKDQSLPLVTVKECATHFYGVFGHPTAMKLHILAKGFIGASDVQLPVYVYKALKQQTGDSKIIIANTVHQSILTFQKEGADVRGDTVGSHDFAIFLKSLAPLPADMTVICPRINTKHWMPQPPALVSADDPPTPPAIQDLPSSGEASVTVTDQDEPSPDNPSSSSGAASSIAAGDEPAIVDTTVSPRVNGAPASISSAGPPPVLFGSIPSNGCLFHGHPTFFEAVIPGQISYEGPTNTALLAPPLFPPAMYAAKTAANEIMAVDVRINKPRNVATIPTRFAQYRREWRSYIQHGGKLMAEHTPQNRVQLVPLEPEQVLDAMDRPLQRKRQAQDRDANAIGLGDPSAKFMQKDEAYGKATAARGIVTFPSARTTSVAAYALAMSVLFKTFHWYAPGCTPTQIAERVHTIAQPGGSDPDEGVIPYDAHKMDASVSRDAGMWFADTTSSCFIPSEVAQCSKLIREEIGVKARTKKAKIVVTIDGTASGSSFTTMKNSNEVGYTSYAGRREDGLGCDASWLSIKLVFGDDCLTSKGAGPGFSAAASALGMNFEPEDVPGDMGVVFLSRHYPTPLSSTSSIPMLVRAISRLSVGHGPTIVEQRRHVMAKVNAVLDLGERTPVLHSYARALKRVTRRRWDTTDWDLCADRELVFKVKQGAYPCTEADGIMSACAQLKISLFELQQVEEALDSAKSMDDIEAVGRSFETFGRSIDPTKFVFR